MLEERKKCVAWCFEKSRLENEELTCVSGDHSYYEERISKEIDARVAAEDKLAEERLAALDKICRCFRYSVDELTEDAASE